MAEPYPIFLDLTDRRCVVVGGGAVALGKVRGLQEAGARVRVVAPELAPALTALVAAGTVEHVGRAYAPGDLAGATLVIAANDDSAVNRRVATEARAAGALVNVVDDPAHCDWTAPAVA